MSLTAGTKLGPYEVLSVVGAGGMGEVYRAHDARLSRDVAIKVLPPAFAADADRLRRFELEARATGSLNHPNLLTVFDIGTYQTFPYLVTELLEGATLRNRLRTSAMPVRKVLDYAVQIARGLAAAHEKGVVHRDLKPENIFVCGDGRLKILDFGLAKLVRTGPEIESAETVSLATEEGTVLGTAGYMSPEQVRGQSADQRSDIFSLGAVLYEMLTGQRAFRGKTSADVASAILKDEPAEFSSSGLKIPPALERIVHHCLEKDPAARFQSARDLTFHLEGISSADSSAVRMAPLPGSQSRRWRKAAPVLVLLAIVATIWWWRGLSAPAPSPKSTYQRLTDFAGLEESPAFSPDGKSVAFVADVTGSRQIWVRLLAGGAPLQITHDAGDHLHPRWSQDSSAIYYYVPPGKDEPTGSLCRVAALGGAPRQLAKSLGEADTSHDGKKVAFFRLNGKQIELVESELDGASAQVVSTLPVGFSYQHPRWSPDDRWIAYQHNVSIWSFDVFVVDASGGSPRQVTNEGNLMSGLAWTANGILYSSARGNRIFYLPAMQLWLTSLDGKRVRQITFDEASYEDPDVDQNGRIVASRRYLFFDIWRFPITGSPIENVARAVRVTRQTAKVQAPSPSPDGKEVAFLSDSGGHGNIWVMDLATQETRQITSVNEDFIVGIPLWSPDGKSIAFALTKHTLAVEYWLVDPDGSNPRRWVADGSWASWSGDSRWLYYSSGSPTRKTDVEQLYKTPMEGDARLLVRDDTGIRAPEPAPDGSGIYFLIPLQNVDGSLEYVIRSARPENGPARTLVRISGNRVPTWQGLHPAVSPDNKWLAVPLNDSFGTNIWLISTADGKLRQITDFGDRRTYIARRVSWSADGRFIFASLGEGDTDIVKLEGMLR